jgi:hypothetical protein
VSVIAELIIGMPFVADRAVLFVGCGLLRIEHYCLLDAVCCG